MSGAPPEDEGPPVPELLQTEGDGAFVEALFRDLGALAQVRAVRVKGGPEAYAGGAADLGQARAALLAGAAAVQVEYAHQGEGWCDTVLRVGEGLFRVVRVRR